MAKTTNTKNAAPQAAEPPAQKKSALPVIAAVLFLASTVCSVLISNWISGGNSGFQLNRGMVLDAFLIIALLLRRERDLVPVALGLKCLNLVVSYARIMMAAGPSIIFIAYDYNITSLHLAVLTTLLALPNLREKLRKVWWLPAASGAVFLSLVTLVEASNNYNGSPFMVTYCLDVYAYLFLCAWLAFPDMTFKGMIGSTQKEPETVAAMMLKWLVQGAIAGVVLLGIMCIASLVENENLDLLLKQPAMLPTFLFMCPVVVLVVQFFSAMRQGAKETKRMKHDMNVIKSSMGGAIGAQAKAELRKEAGKKAANAVIKGALVGDLIGGDTGAVVGAMAAKAKLDQATGSGGSVDGVAKDAVVGGLVTGTTGSVVGGLAAQAQKDAENSIK